MNSSPSTFATFEELSFVYCIFFIYCFYHIIDFFKFIKTMRHSFIITATYLSDNLRILKLNTFLCLPSPFLQEWQPREIICNIKSLNYNAISWFSVKGGNWVKLPTKVCDIVEEPILRFLICQSSLIYAASSPKIYQ